MCVCGTDCKFVACPPSLVAGACVSAAVCGLKGESWCRAVRLHAVLRDVTSADTVSCIFVTFGSSRTRVLSEQ